MMKQLAKKLLPGFLWRVLQRLRARQAARRYQRMLQTFPRRVVEHDYGGHRLKVTLGDPDGASWYDRDWLRLPEVQLLAGGRLRPGARVFNVGAHQGVVAMILAKEVTPGGLVLAIDPQSVNAELIAANCSLNGIDNVIVVRAAAATRAGEVTFGVNLNDRVGSGTAGQVVVPAVSIDTLAASYGRPDVVILDVEGFECEVLAGGTGVMTSGRTDWFVEVHVNAGLEGFGRSAADVLATFPDARYERFVASEVERQFVSLDQGRHLLSDRFYLVALDRGSKLS